MANKPKSPDQKSPKLNDILNRHAWILPLTLFVLGGIATYYVYHSVPNDIQIAIAKQYEPDGSISKAVKGQIEPLALRVGALEGHQVKTEDRLLELSVLIKVSIEKQSMTSKGAENTVQRAINLVRTSQDKREKNLALKVAGDALETASAHHVVVNYKKVNHYGLTLLENDPDDQKEELSKAAKQRTLKFPPPRVTPGPKYIVGGDRVLDGETYENQTFVDCKIIFSDGYLGLENVRFINCTFDVSPRSIGREFYRILFSSDEPVPAITLKSPGSPPVRRDPS